MYTNCSFTACIFAILIKFVQSQAVPFFLQISSFNCRVSNILHVFWLNMHMNIDCGLRPETPKETSYSQKVWLTAAIVVLIIAVLLIARVVFNVLLMALAGCLIATYFHGLGDLLERKTGLKRRICMFISIVGSISLLVTLLWFMGAKIQVQVAELSNSLPGTINTVKDKLGETPIGQKVLGYFSDNNSKQLFDTARQFFSTSFGALGNLYIILFLGIFFTAEPSLYKNGILLLVPPDRKEVAKRIMDRISFSLKGWIKGTLLAVALITIMLAIGLSVIGIPVALILALIAGMLKIIPNFGSMVAMIPGVLLALTVSTNTAIGVALLYIISQTIVSNIITPVIQKKMISIPPALTLISQLIMAALSGALGIILAVPLLSMVIIFTDELYVKKINKAQLIPASELDK